MTLRLLLIRLLVLAVLFNTVVGMPAHEATHLERITTALTTLSNQAEDGYADAVEHDEEADGACALCLAYAHLGCALSSSTALHALAWHTGLPRPVRQDTFVPSPGGWRFASRDPPAA